MVEAYADDYAGAPGFCFFAGLMRAGAGDAVHQVDQAMVVNATMLAQADLTGAAGGDAFAAILHSVLERA